MSKKPTNGALGRSNIAKARPTEVISHWSKLVEDYSTSTKEFYDLVEETLERRQIPKLETLRTERHEGGVLSAKREYLRLMRERYVFDICAAPFGTGFFFSWRFAQLPLLVTPFGLITLVVFLMIPLAVLIVATNFFAGLFFWILALGLGGLILRNVGDLPEFERMDKFISGIPGWGDIYQRFFRPVTYFRTDTGMMFKSAVHNAIMEAFDAVTESKGIILTEAERTPTMRDAFFGRVRT